MTHVEQIEPLYVFAVYMLGSREAAFTAVAAVIAGPPSTWLPSLATALIASEKASRANRFAELDDILRTNSTIPVDLEHPLVRGDMQRLQVLLSELRRTCLITTLRGLAAERRAVFILVHVLGLSIETCATVCDTTPSAVRITEGRARRDLDNYLGARCEHLDARNPCHCPARLGNALARGLVSWPDPGEHDGAALRKKASPGVRELYASLPRVRLPIA